ncbi:MAG: DUF4998 domain-containing protein [Bacteroidales bacterium]
MKQIKIIGALFVLLFMGCSDANEVLDQYTEGGPILYSGKVNDLSFQSGYYRVKVNIFPANDVNRANCLLSWSITNELRDSMLVDYSKADYTDSLNCYSVVIDLSKEKVQGNMWLSAQNIDVFGNKSLVEEKGAFIYGDIYKSTLLNDRVSFNADGDVIIFDRKVGSVGNIVSYERADGTFSPEILLAEDELALQNYKVGGLLKSKTRFLIKNTDIDTLETTYYTETKIPSPKR